MIWVLQSDHDLISRRRTPPMSPAPRSDLFTARALPWERCGVGAVGGDPRPDLAYAPSDLHLLSL
eukprot:209776-Alexandrium_andersonii.AAC.1